MGDRGIGDAHLGNLINDIALVVRLGNGDHADALADAPDSTDLEADDVGRLVLDDLDEISDGADAVIRKNR